jgi:uncharacterized membrane protein YbhN (UPF0104 family)
VALAPLGIVALSVVGAYGATAWTREHRPLPQERWRRWGTEAIQAVPEGLRELRGRVSDAWLPLTATGYWAGDCGVLVVTFHAAHGSAPLGVIVLAYMLGQLGNALPLPGGLGGVEPLMLGVLTASEVDVGLGAAAIVLYRFVSLGLQAATGALAVATLVPALRRSSVPGDA